jgi:8-oxo-dGTP pyrophosphatase MutT (NUDIX family)
MTGSSVLPVTIYKGTLFFLFGKECEKEDSAKGFSDFGGGMESGETPMETALREGAEELSGFLGDSYTIQKHIKTHGGVYKINHNDQYHVHMFYLEYDPNLPKYYNQNHHFLWDRMNKDYLLKTKLFEKIDIEWFTIEDMKHRRSEFRSFYQEIIDIFIQEKTQIKQFVQKCMKKNNRVTRKKHIH